MNFFISLDVLRWCLEELASIEEQRRLWLGNAPGEMSTFDEAGCGVFDDSGVTRGIRNGFMLDRYGSEIVNQFESLSALIRKLPPGLKPDEEIEHPIMGQIRATAKRILESGAFDDRSID